MDIGQIGQFITNQRRNNPNMSHQITITQGQLANSGRPDQQPEFAFNGPRKPLRQRSDSLALSVASPVKLHTQQYSCRICLQKCEPVHYCLCTGGMMCHQQCLRQYLQKKYYQALSLPQPANSSADQSLFCEVCKSPYNIAVNNSVICSKSHLALQLKSKPFKCFMYILYFVFTLCVDGVLLSKLLHNELKANIVTVAIAVLVSLLVVFVFLAALWVCEFILVRRIGVLQIKEIQEEVRARRYSKMTSASGILELSVESML